MVVLSCVLIAPEALCVKGHWPLHMVVILEAKSGHGLSNEEPPSTWNSSADISLDEINKSHM